MFGREEKGKRGMDAQKLVSIVVIISICLVPMACANSKAGNATRIIIAPLGKW